MLNKKQISPLKKTAYIIFSGVFWITIWWIVAFFIGNELLVPTPKDVVLRFGQMATEFDFWISVTVSLVRMAIGYLAAVTVAVLLAAFTHICGFVHYMASPLLWIIKAAPVASFILLAMLWMGNGVIPMLISFLIVLPVVWENLSQGLKEIDPHLLEMSSVYRVPVGRQITQMYLPSVKPYFISACKTAVGLAWKSGVAAEVLCRSDLSIGGHLFDAKAYLETTDVFVWTAVTITLSVLIELLVSVKKSK